jgi:hypothetical protein
MRLNRFLTRAPQRRRERRASQMRSAEIGMGVSDFIDEGFGLAQAFPIKHLSSASSAEYPDIDYQVSRFHKTPCDTGRIAHAAVGGGKGSNYGKKVNILLSL